jgi:hypothetical protein
MVRQVRNAGRCSPAVRHRYGDARMAARRMLARLASGAESRRHCGAFFDRHSIAMSPAQYRDVLTRLGLTQVAAALEDRTCLVAEFLRDALAGEALDVPELEVDGSSGWTSRKASASATRRYPNEPRKSFGIKKWVRSGFGTGDGRLWELPSDRDGASPVGDAYPSARAIRDMRSYIRTAEESYEIRPADARCFADW